MEDRNLTPETTNRADAAAPETTMSTGKKATRAIAGIIVLVIIVAGLVFWVKTPKEDINSYSVMFMQDNTLMMYKTGWKKPAPVTDIDGQFINARIASDDSEIYYLTDKNGVTLNYIDLKDIKKGKKTSQVIAAKDIDTLRLLFKDGCFYYIQNHTLYCCKGGVAQALVNDVADYITDSEGRILYTCYGENSQNSIFGTDVYRYSAGKTEKIVADAYNNLDISESGDVTFFTAQEGYAYPEPGTDLPENLPFELSIYSDGKVTSYGGGFSYLVGYDNEVLIEKTNESGIACDYYLSVSGGEPQLLVDCEGTRTVDKSQITKVGDYWYMGIYEDGNDTSSKVNLCRFKMNSSGSVEAVVFGKVDSWFAQDDRVFFMENCDSAGLGDLYALEGEDPILIDEGVVNDRRRIRVMDGVGYVYFRDGSGDKAMLCTCINGDVTKVDEDVSTFYDTGGEIVYVRNADFEKGTGQLCTWDGVEQKVIADKINTFFATFFLMTANIG